MAFSSRQVRSELLAMGYHEEDISELDVRVIVRRLLELTLKS